MFPRKDLRKLRKMRKLFAVCMQKIYLTRQTFPSLHFLPLKRSTPNKKEKRENVPLAPEIHRRNSRKIDYPHPCGMWGLDRHSRQKLLNTNVRYIPSGDTKAAEEFESENGKYLLVTIPLQSHSIATLYIKDPRVYDSRSVARMHRFHRNFFNAPLENLIVISEKVRQREHAGVTTTVSEYVAKAPISLDEKVFGKREATGVAKNPRSASSLCAMHMELILDEIGIPIFRKEDLQQAHAEGVRKCGRWAPFPGDNIRPQEPSPPPLKRTQPGCRY